MKKTFVLLFIGLISFTQSFSQENEEDVLNPNPSPFINKLNEIFSNKIKFSIDEKKDRLTMDFYSGSQLVRTDKVYLVTVNPEKIYYSQEEKSIILKCKNDMEKKWRKFNNSCFERHIYKNKIVDNYARCNISVEGMPKSQIDEAIEQFKELVILYDKKFKAINK